MHARRARSPGCFYRSRCIRRRAIVNVSRAKAAIHAPSQATQRRTSDLRPPEEIRAGRIRRFVFLGAIVAAVLGVGIYFAARPIGGAIKGWQSRRARAETFALMIKQME